MRGLQSGLSLHHGRLRPAVGGRRQVSTPSPCGAWLGIAVAATRTGSPNLTPSRRRFPVRRLRSKSAALPLSYAPDHSTSLLIPPRISRLLAVRLPGGASVRRSGPKAFRSRPQIGARACRVNQSPQAGVPGPLWGAGRATSATELLRCGLPPVSRPLKSQDLSGERWPLRRAML